MPAPGSRLSAGILVLACLAVLGAATWIVLAITSPAADADTAPRSPSPSEVTGRAESDQQDAPAPRPHFQEEELEPLIPWKRLDLPPKFELVVPWDQAHLQEGKVVAAEGTIVATHNSGRACFLNFDADYRGKFHAVIFSSSFADYAEPPEALFLNRKVRLIGKVGRHQGAPQIVVERPEQIVFLDE